MRLRKLTLSVAALSLNCLAVNSVCAAQKTDLFDLDIDELLNVPISAGSRLLYDAAKQPASVTVISRQQIDASGERTLSGVIALYTPGYFRTEDQDDVIAGFRGLSPDNNSKVLFLVDGKAVNTEWFWGAPDAILNGQDLHWIERIEIVRGPGSAILGQGALLGVINVISIRPKATEDFARLTSVYGENGQRHVAINWNLVSDAGVVDGYLSTHGYQGEPMANEGWVRDRATDAGTIFSLQHHLQRSQGEQNALRFRASDLTVSYREIKQRRDLYNFYRERDEVAQALKIADVFYKTTFGSALQYSFDFQHNTDDYDLYNHQSIDMGGVRERRNTLQVMVHPEITEEFFQWLVGAEYRTIRSGLLNAQGNNYLINEPQALNHDVNQINTYVYENEIAIASVFAETSLSIDDNNDIYFGARADDHPEWGRKLTPRFSWFHNPANDQQIRVSYQQGFRGAVGVHYSGGFRGDGLLSEANFDFVSDNDVLRNLGFSDLNKTEPEEIRALELHYSGAIEQRWRWSITAFQHTIRNIIDVGVIYVDPNVVDIRDQAIGSDRAGSWNGFFYFKNTPGEVKGRGIESEITYEQGAARIAFSHAHVKAIDADAEQASGSMYLVNNANALHFKAYPENIFRLNGFYKWQHDLSARYAHIHALSWWSPSGEKQASLGWGNLAIEWQPTDSMRLQIGINNLWNQSALYPINNNADDALLSPSGTPALSAREITIALTLGRLTW